MKRTIAFAKRNFLELIRDPLSIIFNIGLPAVLLVLMATIDANIDDVSIFPIQSFAPGIIVSVIFKPNKAAITKHNTV